MSELLSDLRYAFRTFATRPVWMIVIVLTLAIGIGANAKPSPVDEMVMSWADAVAQVGFSDRAKPCDSPALR